MYTRRAVVLAKIETSYGTDADPTGEANAILTGRPSVKGLSDNLERNFVSPTLSPLAPCKAGHTVEVSFDVEARTGAEPGTPPEISPLLRACGFEETVVAGTSVAYKPVSDDFESATLYVFLDGICHKIRGCRGNMKFVGEVGKYGVYSFGMRGLYAEPVDLPLPSAAYSAVLPDLVESATLKMTPEGGSQYIPVISRIEFDLHNELFRRDDVTREDGVREIMISSRKTSGVIDPEMVPAAAKNYWSEFRNRVPNQVVFGYGAAGATDKITLTVPRAVYDEVNYQDRGPLLSIQIPFICQYNLGDDELIIVYR